MTDRTMQVLEAAKAKGLKVLEVDYAIALDEPLLGRDARSAIDDLLDKKGTFRTVKTLSVYDLLELAGHGPAEDGGCSDDDNEIADDLMSDEALELVFEAPEGYEGETYNTLVFSFYNEAGDGEGEKQR